MPTYDYRCKNCGHEFELFQSITASVKKKCPACGKMALERLIGTGGAVLFKGGGFYETDYRSDSYKKAEKAEKDAEKPKTEKPDKPGKGGESKPAKQKPETKAGEKAGAKKKATKSS